ncbi:MAG: starch-binding protein, partial [Lachnospiraceae bacterium]|nr:starch-binding protein [Lachnospiraceae bacterium]
RARYDELKAADDQAKAEADAQAAGELTVYVKAPETWTDMGLWAWTSAGNLFEAWPGQAMTACENNEGYYKATIRITGLTSVIFNSSNNEQTKDITDLSAGTYWFDLTLAEGDTQYSAEYTKEAPEGWNEEEKAEIEVLDPEDKEEEEEDKDDSTVEEDKTPTAWDDAKLKVHVQMPDAEGWNKLGAYLFGTGEEFGWAGGSGELTGAWPGVELLPEVNSENGWYAFGGTFADGYYMLIINNFVSDEEAAQGAEKLQAADLEITDGEYWITLALDEETGKYAATVATEAPADYDGEGLESVVETPDDETPDDETPDGETPDDGTPDDKDEQPETGDNAPIAVVTMIALVAGAGAVVIRKRRVA